MAGEFDIARNDESGYDNNGFEKQSNISKNTKTQTAFIFHVHENDVWLMLLEYYKRKFPN